MNIDIPFKHIDLKEIWFFFSFKGWKNFVKTARKKLYTTRCNPTHKSTNISIYHIYLNSGCQNVMSWCQNSKVDMFVSHPQRKCKKKSCLSGGPQVSQTIMLFCVFFVEFHVTESHFFDLITSNRKIKLNRRRLFVCRHLESSRR